MLYLNNSIFIEQKDILSAMFIPQTTGKDKMSHMTEVYTLLLTWIA